MFLIAEICSQPTLLFHWEYLYPQRRPSSGRVWPPVNLGEKCVSDYDAVVSPAFSRSLSSGMLGHIKMQKAAVVLR